MFIPCVPGYCRGREEDPKPLIVIIKTTALDFTQHLHPQFGSRKSVLIPKAEAHLAAPVLAPWARNDFQESCSAVPFLGLGNG